MELATRRLLLFNVTEHPRAEWVIQQVRNLSVQQDHLPKFILHDRYGQFREEFDACAEGSGAQIIKLPKRMAFSVGTGRRSIVAIRGADAGEPGSLHGARLDSGDPDRIE